jgi:hypothetical protein
VAFVRTVRAWAAVHNTGTGLLTLSVVALASLLFADTTMAGIGPFRFLTPVSTLLLLPAVAGVGAAVACVSGHRLPLPDPARAHAARAAWALAWTVLAILAANVGLVSSSGTSFSAITRNVVIYLALSLVPVSFGQASLAWAPVFAYTMAAMLFGHAANADRFSYYWWAVVMRGESTAAQMITAASLLALGPTVYVLNPGRRIRT